MPARAFLALLLVAAASPPRARAAESLPPADVAAVTTCLAGARGDHRRATACIGALSTPCIGDESARVPGEIIDCLHREQRVWDMLLNDAFKTVSDGVEEPVRTKLRDMQRSWIDTRNKTCMFFYDFFDGSMAYPMIANCENRETALRAIFLRTFAEDLKLQKR